MIRPARVEDADEILALIYELAVYEKAPEEAKATVAQIHQSFFSPDPKVFCEIVEHDGQIAGFAIWFLNYPSTISKAWLWERSIEAPCSDLQGSRIRSIPMVGS